MFLTGLHVGGGLAPFDGIVHNAWQWLLCCDFKDDYDALVVAGDDPPARRCLARLASHAELWVLSGTTPRVDGVLHAVLTGAHGARERFSSYVLIDGEGVRTRVRHWDAFVRLFARAHLVRTSSHVSSLV